MNDSSPRGPRHGPPSGMDFIPDKRLFAAVMFALKMMRGGTPPGVANARAAGYYGYPVGEVARHTGQAAGRARGRRRKG